MSSPLDDSNVSDTKNTNIEQLMSLIASGKRTKLHTKSINSWLRKRCPSNTSIKYLYFPEELLQHENIKEIFQSFDRDNSHSLDIAELVKMFKQFNIDINKPDLKKLFDVVDEDHDNALNFSEFKNCALSDTGQRVFNRIMKKVRNLEEKKPNNERNVYLPLSFSAMITYISYRSMRKDVLDQVNNNKLDVDVRAGQFENLINLQNLYKSDIQTDETSKLKEKIMLKNVNLSNMKVEPLIRQLSNIRDIRLESEIFKKIELSPKKSEISPFLTSRKSILEDDESRKSFVSGERRDSIRKSIEKFQRISQNNKTLLELHQLIDEDIEKKKEELPEEIEKLKKSAMDKGKVKAFLQFQQKIGNNRKNLQKNDIPLLIINDVFDKNKGISNRLIENDKKSILDKSISINRHQHKNINYKNSYRDDNSNSTIHNKSLLRRLPLNMKGIEQRMNENLRLVENSEENHKFKKLVGFHENHRKGLGISKSHRERGQKEFKSFDNANDNKVLKKMKEINRKAFESILPRLEEIKKIQGQNNEKTNGYQKLPTINIFPNNQ